MLYDVPYRVQGEDMYYPFTHYYDIDEDVKLTDEQIKGRKKAFIHAASIVKKMCDNYTMKEEAVHVRMPDIHNIVTIFLLILLVVIFVLR